MIPDDEDLDAPPLPPISFAPLAPAPAATTANDASARPGDGRQSAR